MKHNPVILGIVNAVVPGVGYLILKKRVFFGMAMFAVTATSAALIAFDSTFSEAPFLGAASIWGGEVS